MSREDDCVEQPHLHVGICQRAGYANGLKDAAEQTPETVGTRIAESEVTCGAVPVQIEGRLTDGRFFYFRARHRGVTLGFGDSPDDAVGGAGPVVSFDGIGDHAVGWMDIGLAEALLEFLVRAVVREQEIAAESAHLSSPSGETS